MITGGYDDTRSIAWWGDGCLTRDRAPPDQLSLLELFAQAEFEEQTKDLPGTVALAVPYYMGLIERYDHAVLAGNTDQARTLEDEADLLAIHLNNGTRLGIKGDDESPCSVLERATTAPTGIVPRWGQAGDFIVTVNGCNVRVTFGGLYGTCIPQFSAHAIDQDKPFISPTGYRSFMAYHIDTTTGGITVQDYVTQVIQEHITKELKGKLVTIQPEYRRRNEGT